MKLKDLTPLEVVLLAMEKAWREFWQIARKIPANSDLSKLKGCCDMAPHSCELLLVHPDNYDGNGDRNSNYLSAR
jgi:hypothetical protein